MRCNGPRSTASHPHLVSRHLAVHLVLGTERCTEDVQDLKEMGAPRFMQAPGVWRKLTWSCGHGGGPVLVALMLAMVALVAQSKISSKSIAAQRMRPGHHKQGCPWMTIDAGMAALPPKTHCLYVGHQIGRQERGCWHLGRGAPLRSCSAAAQVASRVLLSADILSQMGRI